LIAFIGVNFDLLLGYQQISYLVDYLLFVYGQLLLLLGIDKFILNQVVYSLVLVVSESS